MSREQIYNAEHYDRLAIWVKKGTRDKYKETAAKLGISLAGLITTAVESYEETIFKSVADNVNSEQRKIIDAVKKLNPDAQKQLLKFLDALQSSDA